jgi:anti-sigma B factor antagonist
MSDQPLTYTISDGAQEGVVVIAISGPFTLGNIFTLQNELRTLKPPCLIMDLNEVPFMDSAGLGVVMNYYVSAQGSNRKFFLVGVNDRLKALMEMTRVDGVLKIYDSLDAAEAHA